ncbi:MAG TPA: SPFH domain-containing protein [Candidatus Thermoplasmatota archaeon]|nr:SPFH domain-containing protein [Candidatus Thermoplasmatota archaeon]
MADILTVLAVLILAAIMILALSGVRIVQPYEQGLLIVLGQFRRKLNPGFNWVYPLISQVVKLDLRTQVLDVPRQEVITKDNSPTNVDAIVYIRVISPDKAFFEVTNYKLATIALAQTTLRSVIGDMELDEILYNRERINSRLRDILDHATDAWGVRIEAVEIREVDPVGPVKAAMEEQTSAERQRRAAILRADGEKRSAILTAEGQKRARILAAEGVRQAKILEAEGQRLARILETQGEAQSLRILAMGAAPLDQKSLTVLSLDAVKALGNGQATKIVLPFEISTLMQGVGKFLGAGTQVPPMEPSKQKELEQLIGPAERVLGTIPDPTELSKELAAIEKEMADEAAKTEEIAQRAKPTSPPAAAE